MEVERPKRRHLRGNGKSDPLEAEAAAGVLHDIATDVSVSAYVRVTAASRILELALKAHELEDLEARIEELEEAVA